MDCSIRDIMILHSESGHSQFMLCYQITHHFETNGVTLPSACLCSKPFDRCILPADKVLNLEEPFSGDCTCYWKVPRICPLLRFTGMTLEMLH